MDRNSPKSEWADELPSGLPWREELAHLVESGGGLDDAENEYFEWANDPQYVATATAQRRFKGQLRRRLRHRGAKKRQQPTE